MKRNEKRSVLIVEDDHLVCEMVKGMLDELGFTVAGEAEDGHEALEMVRELGPDVVLMDIRMPRMTGIEAAILIRKHFPTPVVILSAYETEELARDAFAAGAGSFVVKPPRPDELRTAIEVAIGRFGDMMRIRELESELEESRARVERLAGLLPVCPRCGVEKTWEDYGPALKGYFSELSVDEMDVHLCRKCRKPSSSDGS